MLPWHCAPAIHGPPTSGPFKFVAVVCGPCASGSSPPVKALCPAPKYRGACPALASACFEGRRRHEFFFTGALASPRHRDYSTIRRAESARRPGVTVRPARAFKFPVDSQLKASADRGLCWVSASSGDHRSLLQFKVTRQVPILLFICPHREQNRALTMPVPVMVLRLGVSDFETHQSLRLVSICLPRG